MQSSSGKTTNGYNIDEVSFIRPILIVLLILVHCFTVFNGGWPPFFGFHECTPYKWLSRTAYSFMLETFIFISGYVWAFQVIELDKSIPLKKLIKKKFERLVVPSIVFSLMYVALFGNENITNVIGGGANYYFQSSLVLDIYGIFLSCFGVLL